MHNSQTSSILINCGASRDDDDGRHEHTCIDHDTQSTLSHRCNCGYRWYHSLLDGAGGYTSDL